MPKKTTRLPRSLFSKRHYLFISKVLHDFEACDDVIREFIKAFREDNYLFSAEKFKKDCTTDRDYP